MDTQGTVRREYPDASLLRADLNRLKDTWGCYQDWKVRQQRSHDNQLGSEQDLEDAGHIMRASLETHLKTLHSHDIDRAVATGELPSVERDVIRQIDQQWQREKELRDIRDRDQTRQSDAPDRER